MDFGKLEELNLTRDEMSRFSAALKDAQFRELLREYATEISDPENRSRYEREIAELERERGSTVRFLHPEPHHVLKTRGAGGKSFINICSDPLIGAPESEAAQDSSGRTGLRWRLPYSLTPGRQDRDSRGGACVVYDVVFHPDALRMAERSARLMKLVHDTAIDGIRESLGAEITGDGAKRLKVRCKGTLQPAVIRQPQPEQSRLEPEPRTEQELTESTDLEQSRAEADRSGAAAGPVPSQPITPHYSLKYQSVVDLQDYRFSRDSGPGVRPAQILLTVDLPLLRAAADAELHVEERRLLLETHTPAYRLELQLAYPVDEQRGAAQFNTSRRQLTLTLPVRPLTESTDTGAQQSRTEKESGEMENTETEYRETESTDTGAQQSRTEKESEETENTETEYRETESTDTGPQQSREETETECREMGPQQSSRETESEVETETGKREEQQTGAEPQTHRADGSVPRPSDEPLRRAPDTQKEESRGAGIVSESQNPREDEHIHRVCLEPDSRTDAAFPCESDSWLSASPEEEPHSGAVPSPSEPHSGAPQAHSGAPQAHSAALITLQSTLCFQLD